MVRKLFFVLVVFTLLSCDLFFGTFFPGNLGLTVKSVSLNQEIPYPIDDWDQAVKLHLLNGYLFLTVNQHNLLILDENLTLLKSYTNDPSLQFENFAAYDSSNSEYFIGNYIFSSAPDFNPINYSVFLPYRLGYYFSSGIFIEFEPRQSGVLNYWAGGTNYPTPIPMDLELEDVTYDPLLSMTYLFFVDHRSSGIHILATPSAYLDGDIKTLAPSPTYPFGSTEIKINPETDTWRTHFHYTKRGFVINYRGQYRIYEPSGAENSKARLSGTFPNRGDEVFDIAGGYFYFFDGDTKRLYKCQTWW